MVEMFFLRVVCWLVFKLSGAAILLVWGEADCFYCGWLFAFWGWLLGRMGLCWGFLQI